MCIKTIYRLFVAMVHHTDYIEPQIGNMEQYQ